MITISDILQGTPAWVWILLAYLILQGVAAMKTRIILFWRLLIIPSVFTIMGLYGVIKILHFNALAVGAWLVAIAIGCYLGVLLVRHIAIRANQSKGLVELPGSPVTLVLILVIFVVKYAIAYRLAIDPLSARQAWFIVFDAGISGLVTGMFVGRVWIYYKKYKAAPEVDLTPRIAADYKKAAK